MRPLPFMGTLRDKRSYTIAPKSRVGLLHGPQPNEPRERKNPTNTKPRGARQLYKPAVTARHFDGVLVNVMAFLPLEYLIECFTVTPAS